jgi:SAM-dependent methyltransferase
MADRAASGSVNFDRAASFYDATRSLPAPVTDWIAERMEAAAPPDARFLEVGVGTGRIALNLHRRGRWVTGIDLSAAMMAVYRDKAAAAGLPPPRLVRADVTRLPFADASVDVVVEVHLLHLVPGWRPALAEIRRVLAPGGVVLLGGGGGHQDHPRSPRDQAHRRIRELTATALSGRPWLGVADQREKVAALAALGGTAEPIGERRWTAEETWADGLAEVEGRVYSHAWRVPEDAWRAAAARLRAEVLADHHDLDAPVRVERSFGLTAVRF